MKFNKLGFATRAIKNMSNCCDLENKKVVYFENFQVFITHGKIFWVNF